MQELAANQSLTIENNAAATVNVGKNGSMAGVLGNVNILDDQPEVSLTLDDSKDAKRRLWTLDEPAIGFYDVSPTAGSTALGTIFYNGAGLNALTIRGGTGAGGFDVGATAPYFTTTLDTGYGSDKVNVQATSGPLDITSTATNPASGQAQDAVVIGSSALR